MTEHTPQIQPYENNITIVSSFIANANTRYDRKTENYIEFGKNLMKVPINKIIFFDNELIHTIPKEFFNSNTIIIPVKREDNYLYQHKDRLTNFYLNTTYPEKDSLEYMLTICNKTERVRQAIELNPFQSNQFIWVDFGINHLFSSNAYEVFENAILKMKNKIYTNVAIASIWNPNMYDLMCINFNRCIYTDVCWFFAGGVFGGDSASLIKFADLTKKKCLQIIEERQSIMWEVNVWMLVYLENPELFAPYACDHDGRIISYYPI